MDRRIESAGAAAEMSFAAAVQGRASVRRYLLEPVARDDVRRMIALATRAASAGNAQMWRFVAVENAAVRRQLRTAVDDRLDEIAAWPELAGHEREVKAVRAYATFFAEAPLVIAVMALPYHSRTDGLLEARGFSQSERDRLRQRPDLQSVGAAVQLLVTAAHALGYGACWMSAPVVAAEEIERILDVEPAAQLVAIVPVGRPAKPPLPTSRLPLDEVLRFI
jgi:nitroreductase